MKKIVFRTIAWSFLFSIFCCAAVSASENPAANNLLLPQIEKIEPPNWWTNHSINPVRLLIRGANFQNAKVTSANKSLEVSNVRVNKNATYLFFDVSIAPAAKPAKYNFEVETANGKTVIPFEIFAPVQTKVQTITSDDVIYLIMPDRFADGDSSNNKDVDRKNPRAWHGGDFKGIISKIPYLKELGVTAIWLTPWYDNPDEANNCAQPWCPNTNYHGYHAIDYYAVENHFGTLAGLREMIRTCQKNGIKVIQDQVANHVGIQHSWAKNAPLENWFSPFAPNGFKNSVLLSPNASASERDNLLSGWFNELLPDLNQAEPEVAKYEIQNALWWIAATGINGIRQDTIQYMPRTFIRDWSGAIRKQYPRFYIVGEVFEEDSAQTAFFQGGKTGWDNIDTGLPSVFDFKLWRTSQEVFTGKKPLRALRDVLKYDGLYPDVNNITVLTNNHDTDRFMSLPNATLEGAMLHTAFILTTRGIPQLYYGEELAMTGGHDPENRKDFGGGFPNDATDKFTMTGRTADERKMFEWTRKWIKLRKENSSLKNGKTIDLFYDNEAYVFERQVTIDDFGATKQMIFAFNYSEKNKKVEIEPSMNERLSMCFNNFTGLEDVYGQIEFGGAVKKFAPTFEKKCFETKPAKFSFSIPAKSVVAFEIYSIF